MNLVTRVAALTFRLCLAAACAGSAALAAADRPNFVILFADDLGYGDLGCFGHPTIRTPNLDRMANEGVKLTSFYVAASVCTPSRVALLTGRYPMRSGLQRVIFPEDRVGIPEGEITVAEGLKPRGYRTMAIGKWHLGHARTEFLPTSNGFDSYFGLPYSNDMIPPYVETRVPLRFYRDASPIEAPVDQTTLTERYTEEAVKFIRASKDAPFFLYLAYSYPHVPLHASPEASGRSRRGLYGDVVETIDRSVGTVLKTIQDQGVDGNTFVLFTSDNGPWLPKGVDGGSAGLLRDGKGTTYEGGMREPFVARWPGTIPPSLVSAEVATSMDLYATILTAAGATVPADRPVDGKNLLPLLTGKGGSPHEAFYYYLGYVLEAVREGRWKLRVAIDPKTFGDHRERTLERTREGRTFAVTELDGGSAPAELFDLEADPGERFNRIAEHPEIAARLKERMAKFAAGLAPGPAFDLSSRGRPKE
jgi:arylsulfatase A